MKIFLLLVLFSSIQYSQTYPSWFINKSELTGMYICGMVENEYDSDSSFVSAKRDAAERAAINRTSSYVLNDIFHSAGGEKSWMETDKTIKYDTLLSQKYFESFIVIDSFQTRSHTFVIISPDHNPINGFLIDVGDIPQPHWVENIPDDGKYNYSVGVSEKYYYLTETWKNAEENGRIELAQEFSSTSKHIQKKEDDDYTDIVNEIVEATLNNVEVIARWVNSSTKLHYVLLRIPKM